jgi:Transposase
MARERTFSREFKLAAVQDVVSGEQRPAQVCREHEIAKVSCCAGGGIVGVVTSIEDVAALLDRSVYSLLMTVVRGDCSQ